ncbi:MAG TPA: biotin transporter BioY [Candidatus Limnocylindrales bacterium]|nr:biotin transporter BioY [Candidatus Limnocylindrales bacterium]
MSRVPVDQRGITLADFLVPIRVSERLGSRVRHVALIVAGALFIALCTQLAIFQTGQTIPLIADYRIQLASTPVPITGQTLAVLLVGGSLGLRRGVLSVGLYLLAGLVLPVYAGGESGLDMYVSRGDGGALVFGVRGGYLIGFLLAAAITGRLAELGWDRHILGAVAAMLIGNVVIYLVGVPWLALAVGSTPEASALERAIAFGLTPFVIVDAMKLLVAAAAFLGAWWAVGRRPAER